MGPSDNALPPALDLRAARLGDVKKLNSRLRLADSLEIQAATLEDSSVVLEQGFAWSDPCYTIIGDRNEPLAMFGVIPDPLDAKVGRIWLLGSDDLAKHSRTFLRHSRAWVDRLQQRYPTLWNCVDARNEVHIRWLKWCGFTFLRRIEEYGVERRPFYEFERVTSVTPEPPRTVDLSLI
jgi:hypothetical protein